jgi:hypothetical protein
MTRTGAMIGTPQYMSPEQLRGEKVDGRADLYSLGVMLFEMVAGRLPFVSDSTAGYMHKHINTPPPRPSRVVPGQAISPALERVILRLLEKDPERRFADADQLAAALESCLAPGATAAPAGGRRRRALLAAGGVLLAAGVTLMLVLTLGGGDGGGPATAQAPTADPGVGAGVSAAPAATAEVPTSQGAVAWRPAAPVATEATPDASSSQPPRLARAPKQRKPRGRRPRVRPPGPASPPAPAPAAAKGSSVPGLKLTAADRVLAQKSVDKLERQLLKLLSTARVPPSTKEQTLTAYRRAVATYPEKQREQMQRQYLVQYITVYQRPALQLKSYERKPMAELKRIFLKMETKTELSPERRQQIMANTLKTYDSDSFQPKDRTWYKRLALVSLIKSYAVDPAAVLK